MRSAVTAADIKDITQKAVASAKTGDHQARLFLFNYLLGKPVERQIISVGAMDARERELLSELSELYRSMSEVESDDTPSNAAST